MALPEAILLEGPQGISAKIFQTLPTMSNNKFTDTKLCATSSRNTAAPSRFFQ